MKKINIRKLLGVIQAIVMIIFISFVIILDILPIQYILILSLFFLLILLMLNMMMNPKKRKILTTKIGEIINLLISSSLVIGIGMLHDAHEFLLEVNEYSENTMSVLVLETSNYTNISDLDKKVIGISENSGNDAANTLEDIRDEGNIEIEFEMIQSNQEIMNRLYNEDIEAILINEKDREQFVELNEQFNKETRVIFESKIENVISNSTSVKDVTENTFTVFISGHDIFDGQEELGERSDVNMVVTINPVKKQVLLTSLPRDLYVPLASYNGYDKLTHANNYGIEESIATIDEFLDIEIDHLLDVNFSSFIEIVDAIGGVTLYNPIEFRSSEDSSSGNGRYDFPEGEITLDGKKALIYARERQVFLEGDIMRGQNQQRIILAMIEKLLTPSMIFNYSELLDVLSNSFDTTLSDSQIRGLIQMQLKDMSSWEIISTQVDSVPGKSAKCYSWYGKELSVLFPNEDSVLEIQALLDDMENNIEIEVQNESIE